MGKKVLEHCLQGPIVPEVAGASMKGRKSGRVLRTGVEPVGKGVLYLCQISRFVILRMRSH